VREYEVIIIVQPNLEDAARDELVERVAGWLTPGEKESQKPEINHWGQRQLAYPIQNHNQGYYVLYNAQLEPQNISEIEQNMRYVEPLLRYLIVRKED
jgi:small subunit ribosomal protein S6